MFSFSLISCQRFVFVFFVFLSLSESHTSSADCFEPANPTTGACHVFWPLKGSQHFVTLLSGNGHNFAKVHNVAVKAGLQLRALHPGTCVCVCAVSTCLSRSFLSESAFPALKCQLSTVDLCGFCSAWRWGKQTEPIYCRSADAGWKRVPKIRWTDRRTDSRTCTTAPHSTPAR